MTLTVVYDGHCAMCRASMTKLQDLMGAQIQGVDFRTTCVERLHPMLTEERCSARMHVIENGGLYSGAEAMVRILRHHPVFRYIVWAYRVPPIGWLSERAYDFIARHRMTFSKWFGNQVECSEACSVHHRPRD